MLVLELSRCEYILRRENIIALGNSGTGKTHVALALVSIGVQTGPTLRAYRRAKGDHFRRGGEACASIKMRSACRARGGGRA
jgi:hypothetical protein